MLLEILLSLISSIICLLWPIPDIFQSNRPGALQQDEDTAKYNTHIHVWKGEQ